MESSAAGAPFELLVFSASPPALRPSLWSSVVGFAERLLLIPQRKGPVWHGQICPCIPPHCIDAMHHEGVFTRRLKRPERQFL